MAIIVHPLTAVNNNPIYTADNYRHAVNSLLLPCDGSPFGCVNGIRYTGTYPIVSVNGATVTIEEHAGFYAGWSAAGIYTYALTHVEKVTLPNIDDDFKVFVEISDPSQAHGDKPQGQLSVVNATVPDSNINGVVLARVGGGIASETAIRVDAAGKLYAPSESILLNVRAVDGTLAVVWPTGAEFERQSGRWVQTNKPFSMTAVWGDPLVMHATLQPLSSSASTGGSTMGEATHMATLYFLWTVKGASTHNPWDSTIFAHFSNWIATSEGWGQVYANTNNNLADLRCYVNGQDISLRSRGSYTLFAPNWYQGSVVFPCKRV